MIPSMLSVYKNHPNWSGVLVQPLLIKDQSISHCVKKVIPFFTKGMPSWTVISDRIPVSFFSGTTDNLVNSTFLGSMLIHRNAVCDIITIWWDYLCGSKTSARGAEIGLSNSLFSVVVMENNHIAGNGNYCESFGFKARDTSAPGMVQVIMWKHI